MIRETFQRVAASLINPAMMGKPRVILAIGFFVILSEVNVAATVKMISRISVWTHSPCCIRVKAVGFASTTFPVPSAEPVER
jgi:hypothetical protein